MSRKIIVRGVWISGFLWPCLVATQAQDRTTSLAADVKIAGGQKPARSSIEEPSKLVVRGTVVDESAAPAANVEVIPFPVVESHPNLTAHTDAAGKFVLTLPYPNSLFQIAAQDKAQGRLGFLRYVPGKTETEPRIVLVRGRPISVTVVDAKEQPVVGARVGMAFRTRNGLVIGSSQEEELSQQFTDGAGKAVLRIPPGDKSLACVFAVKRGVGFDYFIYRAEEPAGRSHKLAPDDSGPIRFVLVGVRKTRVHVVDQQRKPLPGVRVSASFVQRRNKGGPAIAQGIAEFKVATDRSGIAEFGAIPVDAWPILVFGSASMAYSFREQTRVNPTVQTTDVTVVTRRLPILRLRVTYPDGRPALGAGLYYTARHYSLGGGVAGWQLYVGEVEQDMCAFRDDSYCVVRAALGHQVSAIAARVARVGEPLRPVHLVLQPATRVHGTLTVGKEGRAAANETVTLIQRDEGNYSKLPEAERLPDVRQISLDMSFQGTTDAEGRYEFYAPPGSYVIGPAAVYFNQVLKTENAKTLFAEGAQDFRIKEQPEIEVNLHRENDSPSPQTNRRNTPSLKPSLR